MWQLPQFWWSEKCGTEAKRSGNEVRPVIRRAISHHIAEKMKSTILNSNVDIHKCRNLSSPSANQSWPSPSSWTNAFLDLALTILLSMWNIDTTLCKNITCPGSKPLWPNRGFKLREFFFSKAVFEVKDFSWNIRVLLIKIRMLALSQLCLWRE